MSFMKKAHQIVGNRHVSVKAEFYKIACMRLAEYVHPDMKYEILEELQTLFQEEATNDQAN